MSINSSQIARLAATGNWFFDDIAINDGTGSFQNTYPGTGKIIHLRPNAAGDNAGWTRAGTDSGANWSQVNNVTPDTDGRVRKLTTVGTDDYNIDATPADLDSASTVKVVAVGVRWRGSPP